MHAGLYLRMHASMDAEFCLFLNCKEFILLCDMAGCQGKTLDVVRSIHYERNTHDMWWTGVPYDMVICGAHSCIHAMEELFVFLVRPA